MKNEYTYFKCGCKYKVTDYSQIILYCPEHVSIKDIIQQVVKENLAHPIEEEK